MLVWGWRVPFLLAVLTLVAAIVLRYNMPESQEVSQGVLVTRGVQGWTVCLHLRARAITGNPSPAASQGSC